MRSIDVLEMIKDGRIEELKAKLQDEVYADALKNKSGAKKRYAAMKKYFTYIKTAREFCQKPCMIEFEGKSYTSFCNSFSLALTTEPCGTISLFTDVDRYPEVQRLIKREGTPEQIDFAKVFAEAKSRGYKLKQSELGPKYTYLMLYNDTYFKLGLVDATFAIIDDGSKPNVYHRDKRSVITIENDIGVCTIMPMNISEESLEELGNSVVVIEV